LELNQLSGAGVCGVDWADVPTTCAIIEPGGGVCSRRASYRRRCDGSWPVAGAAGRARRQLPGPDPVAIRDRPLTAVACLRATGRRLFAITPLAWPANGSATGGTKKSDAMDAAAAGEHPAHRYHAHRRCPRRLKLAQAVAVLRREPSRTRVGRTRPTQAVDSQLRE